MNGTRPMWPMGMSLCCYCRAFLYSLKIWKRYGAENLRTVCIYAIEYWLVTVCVCVCVCVLEWTSPVSLAMDLITRH